MNNIQLKTCDICSGPLQELPVPYRGRALVSDGRVLPVSLAKVSCLSCGAASHRDIVDAKHVQATFSNCYALPTFSPVADLTRARKYAKLLSSQVTASSCVLEIGCGSGNLLKELANRWKSTYFLGIEPALASNAISSGRLQYVRSFFCSEIVNTVKQKFDLIFSVNVIEHTHSPRDFFKLTSKLLADQGQAVVICPSAVPANVELLFYDHLYTFTPRALAMLAAEAGLVLARSIDCLPDIGNFQLLVFERCKSSIDSYRTSEADIRLDKLAALREQYLFAWENLESHLLRHRSIDTKLAMFGAGQMAAMLRAYAPNIWHKVEYLLTDDPSDAWQLEKPVLNYSEEVANLDAYTIIIATAPEVQGIVAQRLARDGIKSICFSDVILN